MSTADWLPAGFTVQQIDTNRTRLSVAVGGSGPVLILLQAGPRPHAPGPASCPTSPRTTPSSHPICAAPATVIGPRTATPSPTRPTTYEASSPP
ncbi:hypothetical protein SGPA1_40697 [Streptomyces misionensis JCM 4497]